MLIFYFLFFIFLDNLSYLSLFNLNENKPNFVKEFFFCVDSFSTTALILYLVIYFIFNNWIIVNILSIKLSRTSFFYLKIRFYSFLLKNLILAVFVVSLKKVKFFLIKQLFTFEKIAIPLKNLFFNKFLLWRPLFKRWSYFGIWAKTNNKK